MIREFPVALRKMQKLVLFGTSVEKLASAANLFYAGGGSAPFLLPRIPAKESDRSTEGALESVELSRLVSGGSPGP